MLPQGQGQRKHRGKTFAHALTSAFPVCTCCSVVGINLVVRHAACKACCCNDTIGRSGPCMMYLMRFIFPVCRYSHSINHALKFHDQRGI